MTDDRVAPLVDFAMPRPRALARGRLQRLAAEAGARAVVRAGADLRLRLQPLDASVSRSPTPRPSPTLNFIGLGNYEKLWTWTFETDPPSNWYTALVNMGLFGGLYVIFCLVLGLTLAILLDQKIRGEGILRPIYLYPLALSFIVTGTAWKLFLDPRIGLEKAMHDLGWTSFHFDWVVNPRMMIYCVAIAGIWQTSGFVMAMFLAGAARHRRRDPEGRADRRRLRLTRPTGASSFRSCARSSCRR